MKTRFSNLLPKTTNSLETVRKETLKLLSVKQFWAILGLPSTFLLSPNLHPKTMPVSRNSDKNSEASEATCKMSPTAVRSVEDQQEGVFSRE